jgi:hypothetical protein
MFLSINLLSYTIIKFSLAFFRAVSIFTRMLINVIQ